jgi:hypothetical protein
MLDSLFSDGAAWFSIPAILATIFFIIRLAMSFFGADLDLGHGALNAGLDVLNADPSDLDALHSDPSQMFHWLSVQSIAAFVMGFGWGGLAALRGSGWSPLISVLVGVGVGVAMVWVLGILLKTIYRMQVSGNIAAESAIGVEGDVYLSIPSPDAAKGTGLGKVRLVIDRRQRLYNAVSDASEIPTHARVRVLRVNPDNSLTVTRVPT